jgi:hypothetical protein
MFLYISEPLSSRNLCCSLDPLLAMSGRLWLLNATWAKFESEIENCHGLSEKAWDRYIRRRWRDHCWQLKISIDGVDLSARMLANPGGQRGGLWPISEHHECSYKLL